VRQAQPSSLQNACCPYPPASTKRANCPFVTG